MDDPTVVRKDSYFQGVPIFWGFSKRYPVSCGENLYSRRVFILAYLGRGIPIRE